MSEISVKKEIHDDPCILVLSVDGIKVRPSCAHKAPSAALQILAAAPLAAAGLRLAAVTL